MADKKYLTPYEKRKAEAAKRKKQQQAAAAAAALAKRKTSAAQASSGIPARVGPEAGKSAPAVKPSSTSGRYQSGQGSGMGYGAMAGVSASRNNRRSQAAQTSRLSGMAAATPKKPAATTPGRSDMAKNPASTTRVTPPSSSTGRSGSSGSSNRGSGNQKPRPGKPVLQQNTMWVTAKESKTGKGYLAQKGKPEKRVTARVKIQEATTSGKAAGSTYAYKAGRTVKKGR